MNDILAILSGGDYVSGEKISQELGISRAAVWKAIDALRKEGYALSGTPKAGYVLSPSDVLREEELSAGWKSRIEEDFENREDD